MGYLPYVSTGAGFLPSTVGASLFSTESLTYRSKNQRSSPEQTFITSQYYWLIYSDFYRGTRSVGSSKWLTHVCPKAPPTKNNDFPIGKSRHFMNRPSKHLGNHVAGFFGDVTHCRWQWLVSLEPKKTWNIDLAKTRSNTLVNGYRCAFDKIYFWDIPGNKYMCDSIPR